jgi:hypothetical protein
MTDLEGHPEAQRSIGSPVLIGVAIVILAVVTAAVVLLAGDRQQEYPADSPEGMLQRYLASFEDRDYEAAYAHFSTEVKSGLDLERYLESVRQYGFPVGQAARRVFIDEVSGDGDERVMRLTVEDFYGDGFGGDSYRSERQIRIVRESGGWYIDEPLVGLDPTFGEPL